MNWFKSRNPKQPLSSSTKHPFQHALDNIQTHLSNIIRTIPNPFSGNLALSKAEIMNRMSTVPIYALTDNSSSEATFVWCPMTNKHLDLRYLSKTDADDYLRDLSPWDDNEVHFRTCSLATVVESEGNDEMAPIRLVPELSQVKNALQEIKKKDGVAFSEDAFSGVPVFQSDELRIKFQRETNEWKLTSSKDDMCQLYRPAYFKKEDLQSALATQMGSQYEGAIQVTSLEDIIKEMKDGSTSKSNDVIFMSADRVG